MKIIKFYKTNTFLNNIVWNLPFGWDFAVAEFLGKFGIWTLPLKFFVYGRKIEDNIEFFKFNHREKEIIPYLKKCFYFRKKFKIKLEEPDYYEKKVAGLFKFYKIGMVGTFFDITATDTTAIIGYAKELITSVQPLMLIVIGVAVGIFIFWAIVRAIK